MAKEIPAQPPKPTRSREGFDANLIGVQFVSSPVSSGNYTTGYMLEDSQQKIAIAYEVARAQQKPIAEAIESYSADSAPLKSVGGSREQLEGVMKEAYAATPEKPSVIMVNYKIGGVGSKHWAPIVVSKDKEGNFKVTQINSRKSRFYQVEIADFQKGLVAGLQAQNPGKTIMGVNTSRDVQHGNVCGLASANAIAAAISGSNENPDLLDPKKREFAYKAQGQRTFAVIEHLTGLDGAAKEAALNKPILEVEKEALVKGNFLSPAEAALIKNSAMIDSVLVFKAEMEAPRKKSNIIKDESYDQAITEYIKANIKGEKFDPPGARQQMSDYLYALKLQSKDLPKEMEKSVKNIVEFAKTLESKKKPEPAEKGVSALKKNVKLQAIVAKIRSFIPGSKAAAQKAKDSSLPTKPVASVRHESGRGR